MKRLLPLSDCSAGHYWWKAVASTETRDLAFDLLENGLDFVVEALERLTKRSVQDRDLKYGVLHLGAGIELVLKERLRLAHWAEARREAPCCASPMHSQCEACS